MTEHSPRVFVEELTFRTGTGHDDGSDWRRTSGLHEAGPHSVVTPLAVLGFDANRRLELRSFHPGSSVDEVRAATGFELGVADSVHETPAPTDAEIAALDRVDPQQIRMLEFRDGRDKVLRALAERSRS